MSGNLLVFSSAAQLAVHYPWRLGGKKPSMREMRQEINLSTGLEKVLPLNMSIENVEKSLEPPATLLFFKKIMKSLPRFVVDRSPALGDTTETDPFRRRFKH